MIWDYKAKLKLYDIFVQKLSSLEKESKTPWIPVWQAKYEKKPRTNPAKWNRYLDELGCTRIVRNKISGWELQDSKEPPKPPWKSVNMPGFVHLSNPLFPGNFHKSEYIVRIPKEVAEKILILGMP